MGQFTIYKPTSEAFATVYTGEETVYNGDFMSQNKVVASFKSPVPLKFKIGMYMVERGHIFRLPTYPIQDKTGSRFFSYTATFEGVEYKLYNKQMIYQGRKKWSYYGTAAALLALVISNANEIDPTWSLGTIEATQPMLIEFDKTSCRQAITMIAEKFGLEYKFQGKIIHMATSVGGLVRDVVFRYGQSNGLKQITVTPVTDSGFATRFFGIGGSQNLPDTYRGGLENLTFEEDHIDVNVDLYGVIESTIEFPDIFPQRTGSITSSPTPNSVIDTTLDFDLNSVMIDGQAKIVFKNGALGGKEYEISSYDAATKKIVFNTVTEKNGYIHPNATLHAVDGDQYVLVDMEMPPTYIANKETDLRAATLAYATRNGHPPLSISLGVDEMFIKQNNLVGVIDLGDKIKALDTDLEVDSILRVQSMSYPIVNPAKVTFTISDKVTYSQEAKQIVDVKQQTVALQQLSQASLEAQRLNSIRRRELQGAIFDPDGYFDGGKIKPLSIETISLVVSARSQDFSLSTLIKPNLAANPNAISWTAGILSHFSIDPNIIKTWNIAGSVTYALAPTSLYYVYARCLKAGTDGTLVMDIAQRKFDADPTYYYFLVGVLHPVNSGVRALSLTYGASEINGRFVTTGRIQSADGLTYFDLDAGVLSGKIIFRSSSTGTLSDVSTIETAASNAQTTANTANSNAVLAGLSADAANSAAGVAAAAAYAAQGTANSAGSAAAAAQATADAAQISASAANVAAANAVLTASNDATTKANSAYSAAVAAAGTDASAKANQAYTDAAAYAAAQYSALTATLKAMAYQDIVQLAYLGETVIEGGYLRTTLLDAAYIRSNIINADYIEALDIVATNIEATTGTIGGWTITSTGISSAYYGDLSQFVQIDLNKVGEIQLRAYSEGYKYDPDLQIWVTDPASGTIISSKISPKGIEIKTNSDIIASFKQMANYGQVAMQAEAPPGSTAAKVVGRLEVWGLPHRDYPNNPAYFRNCFLAWTNRDGIEQVEFIDLTPFTYP